MKKLLILAVALAAQAFAAFAETGMPLDDAEIVGIVMAANRAEIDAGNLAYSVSTNRDVKMFGRDLAEEHERSSSRFGDWAAWRGITPRSGPTSDELKAEEEKFLENLGKQSGILFDLDYINHEVESHQHMLDLLENKLIPAAQNEGLKKLLREMRRSLTDHHERARLIKVSLGRKK
ncbi:MAG: membrane protein [Nitrosospira sp.]